MHELSREVDSFRRALPRLLQESPGAWALVKGDRVLGAFPSEDEALREGYRVLGDEGPFLVKRIVPSEEEVPASLGVAMLLE